MEVNVFNQNNKKAGTTDLSDRIFNVKWNPDLVQQALTVQLANQHLPWAYTKGRGEVRGGGRKPWKQKGTGRARHGSTRSPIWKGGGVTFGPSKERIFAKKISKKMKRLAIFSLLSKKAKDNELKVIDRFDSSVKKAKEWDKIIKNLAGLESSVILIPATDNKDIHRLISNLKKIEAISPYSLNVYDLLKHKNIILEKAAAEEIEKHYK